MKLYYLGQPGDGYGWGVANSNLVSELRKLCTVELAPLTRKRFDAPIFVPISRGDLAPEVKYDAPRVIGYCFTEWPIPDTARRNARIYDVLFAGSTWNANKLKSAGIKQAAPLLQGIDHDRFKPQPWTERKGFCVFSGGKYEFRKAQDVVIAAVGTFMRQHGDVTLLTAWHNPWPQTMRSMESSWLIDAKNPLLGIPEDRIIQIGAVPNDQTPGIYSQAHIGVFPNRCEAGTNLVMCEFMACGRPVIATYAHGHKDVFPTEISETIKDETGYDATTVYRKNDYPYLLANGSYDPAGWFNCNVSDILAHLEHAYQHRTQLPELGAQCRAFTERLTWGDCAAKIYEAAFQVKAQGLGFQPVVPGSEWPQHSID